MRVTQSMLNSQMMVNLEKNNARYSRYQNELSSGKRLNKPGDDPVGVGYAMRYHAQIDRNAQYQEAVKDGQSQLDFADTTLSQVNEIMQRARELAVRGSTGSMSTDARTAISSEIDQLYQQLRDVGNTQLNGRYIFNGQLTDVKPYGPTPESNTTDTSQINYVMSEGISMTVNVTGEQVFGDATAPADIDTSDNAFAILTSLKQALNTGNEPVLQGVMGRIDSRMSKMQAVWADVGARSNRAQLLSSRLSDLDLNLNDLLSKTEDANMEETIMNLRTAENVQRASLSAGSRIIQPTLVDFLR